MHIITLEDAHNYDVSLLGGKAFSLSKLVHAGKFNVPKAFVVTTEVSKVYAHTGTVCSYESEIFNFFDNLDCEFVAVRSSAVVEDGATAVWAGQFQTFLYVDRSMLIDRIQACMDSAKTERVIAYKENVARVGESTDMHVAVLVQAMVSPNIAGVAFSVHPISHNANTVLIEAVEGIGSTLVDGSLTPDTYELDKVTGGTLSAQCGVEKAKGIMSVQEQQDLLSLIINIEKYFHCPQDIEWAIASGFIWILQSRPITGV